MSFIIIAPGFSSLGLTGLTWGCTQPEGDLWDHSDWVFGVEVEGLDPLHFDSESQARAWLESLWAARPPKVVPGAYSPGDFKVIRRE